ncbi:MAG: M56 family metallopeptidase [Prevotellaceae bacterium]|jgi:TonB family protein|nr:M56 family metallopeptidase [Prevotellaceae bacterium]
MVFLSYLLESGVCTAILWLAYYALLRKETHFVFNRFYLLSVIPLGSMIPLLRLPLLLPEEGASLISVGEFSTAPLAAPVTQSFSFTTLLLIIYFAGAGFAAFRFCRQLYHMHRVMAASRFPDAENYPAFTFFRKIYINKNTLCAGDYEKILWHEQAHARQLHSVDLVAAQLFVIIQWFNPFAWLLKKSIVATHEYLADAQVLARGVDVNIYQKLLFQQTAGVYPGYASGFSYSLTKKRLIMMKKNTTGKFFALKLSCLLPAIVLPVALFGLSTAEPVSPVLSTAASMETHIQAADSIPVIHINPDNAKKVIADGTITILMKSGETLVLRGNDENLKGKLKDISPEDINSISAQKDTESNARAVSSTSKNKKNATITIQTESGETLVFSGDNTKWPESLAGNIRSITVQKDTAAGGTKIPPPPLAGKDTAKKKVSFSVPVYQSGEVDVQPEYPGGMEGLMNFIRDNLKYPKEAADKKIEGRVAVGFTIHADGKIANIEVLKSVHPLLDAEAERIVRSLSKWTPGQYRGKAVAVRFILPITFRL